MYSFQNSRKPPCPLNVSETETLPTSQSSVWKLDEGLDVLFLLQRPQRLYEVA